MDAREITRLYGVRLPDFVRARDALATRLREAGRPADAAEVRRLPKPSLPAWLVNRLARREPSTVGRLVRAVERLKAAQLGKAAANPVTEATDAERQALARLRAEAEAIGKQAGVRTSAATLERVTATLLAAAADPTARVALSEGRLPRELRRPGFEVFAGEVPVAVARRRPRRSGEAREATGRRARVRVARAAVKLAESEVRRARRRAAGLEARAARQRRAAEEAARAAERLQQEARQAAERLEVATAALRAVERGVGSQTARSTVPGRRRLVAE